VAVSTVNSDMLGCNYDDLYLSITCLGHRVYTAQ